MSLGVAPEYVGDLAQQFIAGGVADGVVDDLELIQVNVKHYMPRALGFCTFHCLLDSFFKRGTVQ